MVRYWTSSVLDSLELCEGRHCRRSAPLAVSSLALDAGHGRLLSAHKDSYTRLWDLGVGRATRCFFHRRSSLRSVILPPIGNCSPNGLSIAFDSADNLSQLVSGGSDGSWNMWDLRTCLREPTLQHMQGHGTAVGAIAVCGHRLLSASVDGHALLWDLRRISPPNTAECLAVGTSGGAAVKEAHLLGDVLGAGLSASVPDLVPVAPPPVAVPAGARWSIRGLDLLAGFTGLAGCKDATGYDVDCGQQFLVEDATMYEADLVVLDPPRDGLYEPIAHPVVGGLQHLNAGKMMNSTRCPCRCYSSALGLFDDPLFADSCHHVGRCSREALCTDCRTR